MNFIVLFFQLTSRLCLTNQSWSKNMSIPFKSITIAFSYSLYPLISISRDTTLITSLFFILSALKTSNKKFISLVCIYFSLTNCSLIPICVYLESTSALTLRFLLFFVFTFAHMFNFLSILLHWFGITYLFWEFTKEISCTMPTQDLLQNSVLSCHFLHCLILLESFFSSLTVFLYSSWWYALFCHIWNISVFSSLFSSNISSPCGHICCN